MTTLVDTDFEGGTVGLPYAGEGDAGGAAWTETPAGCSLIANDPGGVYGQCLHLGAAAAGTVEATFASTVAGGIVHLSQHLRRPALPLQGDVYVGLYAAVEWAAVKFDWDTDLLRVDGSQAADNWLYTEAGHPATPAPFVRDADHLLDLWLDTETGRLFVRFDGTPLGIDEAGAWQPAIPVGSWQPTKARWSCYSTGQCYIEAVECTGETVADAIPVGPYAVALQDLLPRGRAWTRRFDTVLGQLVRGLSEEAQRVEDRGRDLIEETLCRSASGEMLDDWEEQLGIPDECLAGAGTVAARWVAVLAKLTARGGQSRAYYIALAAAMGYAVTIVEHNASAFRVEQSTVEEAIDGTDWLWTWEVIFAVPTDPGTEAVECVIKAKKPAHTAVFFTYP